MKPHRFTFALAGTLFALLLVAGTSIASGRQGRISGKVTDARGAPIADVRVTITTKASSSFKKELKTGQDGSYATILNDATVSYHHRFAKLGFLTVETAKKVPIWNPSDEGGVHPSSASMSVLDVRLPEEAPAVKKER